MSSLRIPKLAISQNGLDPSIQKKKKKAPPKRNPHRPPSPSSKIYHSNPNPSRPLTTNNTPHKPTQNRRLLLRTHDDSSSDDEDDLDLSDKDGISLSDSETESEVNSNHIKPHQTSPKTKLFTSFASGKRLRTEHDLEPKPKRRKTTPSPQPQKKRKRKRKPKAPSLCVICNTLIPEENKGKYCTEACKEEGKIRNKEKRAERKKQKQLEDASKKEDARVKEAKHHKMYIRRNTATKFGEIFKDKEAGRNLEKRIYRASGGELNDTYSKKVKDLAYNLDKNKQLLQRVLTRDLNLKELSLMTTEELAPKDLARERKQREEQFKKENTLQNKMIFGKVITDGQYIVEQRDDTPHSTSEDTTHTIKDKTPSPTPISTVSTVSTMDHRSESPSPSLSVPKKEFNPNEMSELLKSCKSKIRENEPLKMEDEPLKIQMDSSDDEETEEEEDIEMSVLEAPEPPPIPQYLREKEKKKRNVWNGTVRKSSNDKALNVSLYRIGGKDVKLKSVIPKHLQINGRTKFKDISECLKDLVKVTKSKFTMIVSARCEGKYKKEYREIMKECRSSKKGFVIDMKQTKAKIKMILLPSFGYKSEEGFDVESVQKLWKCSLPKTQDLWGLLTVYNKSCKEDKKQKHKPQSVKTKVVEAVKDEMKPQNEIQNGVKAISNGDDKMVTKHKNVQERDRKYDERDRDRHSDRNRYKDRDGDRSRERYRDRDRKRSRERDRDGHRNKDKYSYRDRERHHDRRKEKSRHYRHKDEHRHGDDRNRHHTLNHTSSRSK